MAEFSGGLHRQFGGIVKHDPDRCAKELRPRPPDSVLGITRIILVPHELYVEGIDGFLANSETFNAFDFPDCIDHCKRVDYSAIRSEDRVIRTSLHSLKHRERAAASA